MTFYQTDGLKYFTQIECRNRYGKDAGGRKVTGLQFLNSGKKLLITTNDSRLRLYDMEDYSMTLKYKGLENDQLQIHATFNEAGTRIICGSDDCNVFVWETQPPEDKSFFSFAKDKDTNQAFEYFKGACVQCAVCRDECSCCCRLTMLIFFLALFFSLGQRTRSWPRSPSLHRQQPFATACAPRTMRARCST